MSVLDLPVTDIKMRTDPPSDRMYRKIWDRLNFRPYPTQEAVLLSPVRNKVWAAGRRSGKSRVGGHRALPEVFRAILELQELRRRGLRRELWIVGPEYTDSEKEFRVVWNAANRLQLPLDHPGSYYNVEAGEMVISLFDRNLIIHAKSAKYPTTLVGEGLTGVIFSEAAKLKPSVWYKFLRPTLADFDGWAQFGSTPEGKNWFYDIYMNGLDPDRPDWAAWRTPCWLNPYVYPLGADERLLHLLEMARRRRELDTIKGALRWAVTDGVRHPLGIDPEIWSLWLDMPSDTFNQEEAAEFNEYVGRVFKDFDEEIHVTTSGFRAGWHTYAAVDPGFTNPFVWLLIQVSPDGSRVHVLDEYYETGRSDDEAAKEIKARQLAPLTCRGFYNDPAAPQTARALAQELQIPALSAGSLPVVDRVRWIQKYLRWGSVPDGAALTIETKCVHTIREFGAYRYKETADQAAEKNRSAPENPLKKDDHTPEALGRFFSGRFGALHGSKPRQSRAQVTKGRS